MGLAELGAMRDYDLHNFINHYLGDDPSTNPYVNSSYGGYADLSSLTVGHGSSLAPLFLSLNVQSLNSKYLSLKDLVNGLTKENINLNAIALQEVWNIPHPDLLKIDNYQLFLNQRSNSRGGGVGFYIREGLSAKVVKNLSPLYEGILECLTVELFIANKKIFLTSFYRPPTNDASKIDLFLTKFDELLELLHRNNSTYLLFGDANINLLKISHCPLSQKYLNTIHSNGFINGIFKATRIQGPSYSLIDHILVKNEPTKTTFKTVICDISDHFITSVTWETTKAKRIQKTVQSRNFNYQTMSEFQNTLNGLDWNLVYSCNDSNTAFNIFLIYLWTSLISIFQ